MQENSVKVFDDVLVAAQVEVGHTGLHGVVVVQAVPAKGAEHDEAFVAPVIFPDVVDGLSYSLVLGTKDEGGIARLHVAPVRAVCPGVDAWRDVAVFVDQVVEMADEVGIEILVVSQVSFRFLFQAQIFRGGGKVSEGFGVVEIVRRVVTGDALVVVGAHGRHQFQRIVGDDVGGVGVVLHQNRPHLLEIFQILGLLVPHKDGVRADVLLVDVETAVLLQIILVLIDDFSSLVRHAGIVPGPGEVHHVAGHEHVVLHLVDALVIGAVALIVSGNSHVHEAGVEGVLDFLFREPQLNGLIQQLVPVFLGFRELFVEDRLIEVGFQFADLVRGRRHIGIKYDHALALPGSEGYFIAGGAPGSGLQDRLLVAAESALVKRVDGGGDVSFGNVLVERDHLVVTERGVAPELVEGAPAEGIGGMDVDAARYAFVARADAEVGGVVAVGHVLHRHLDKTVERASGDAAFFRKGEHLEGVFHAELRHLIAHDGILVVLEDSVAVVRRLKIRAVHEHQFRRPVVEIAFRGHHEGVRRVPDAQLVGRAAVVAEGLGLVYFGRRHGENGDGQGRNGSKQER